MSNVTNCNVQKIWTDIFWFLWNPYTEFTVQYLPCIEREDKESVDEFAKRCQAIIADYLKVSSELMTNIQL